MPPDDKQLPAPATRLHDARAQLEDFDRQLEEIEQDKDAAGGKTVHSIKRAILVSDRLGDEDLTLIERLRDHTNTTQLTTPLDPHLRKRLHDLSLRVNEHIANERQLLENEVRLQDRRDGRTSAEVVGRRSPGRIEV